MQKSIYNVIVILLFLLGKISPQSSWKYRLKELLETPVGIKFLEQMGFPADWKERPIWAEFLKS